MPDSERFNLRGEPVAGVLLVLDQQSNPGKLLGLRLTGEEPVSLRELADKASSVPASHKFNESTFKGHLGDLVAFGLLGRSKRGNYLRTALGNTAMTAINEYQAPMIDPVVDVIIDQYKRRGLADRAAQLEQYREQSRDQIQYPGLMLEIMGLQASLINLNVLLSTPLSDQPTATGKEILLFMASRTGVVPNSTTYRRAMKRLYDHGLVKLSRESDEQLYKHSTLGQASLVAYKAYQDRLAPVVTRSASSS